jgi:hypothetical protein
MLSLTTRAFTCIWNIEHIKSYIFPSSWCLLMWIYIYNYQNIQKACNNIKHRRNSKLFQRYLNVVKIQRYFNADSTSSIVVLLTMYIRSKKVSGKCLMLINNFVFSNYMCMCTHASVWSHFPPVAAIIAYIIFHQFKQ